MKKFYLSVQQCLLHPSFAFTELYGPGKENLLKTYEEYRKAPSCKINSLVEIVHHHLAADDAPGIEPSRQRSQEAFFTPSASESPPVSAPPSPLLQPQQEQTQASDTPDKIIVYVFFISSFSLITMVSCAVTCDTTRSMWDDSLNLPLLQVLKHHNIKFVTIDGNKKQRDRVATLEEFKNSGRDGPRVLLLSNVGSIGLNIAFANILIIVVRADGLVVKPTRDTLAHCYFP